ncbi:STAS domain-containing protein [Fervidobacterium gondwanense]|uniref:STAS domain-containing protein n=1 Tax=Fervidobacterium gondwanense TaxID=44754 RepID=UPI003C7070E7
MYDYTEFDNAVAIKMTGSLNTTNAAQFKDCVVREFITSRKQTIIVFDMSAVENIDSYGLGIIVGIYKRLITESRYLKIVSPNKNIKRLFELTGLDRIIKVYEHLSEALSDQ